LLAVLADIAQDAEAARGPALPYHALNDRALSPRRAVTAGACRDSAFRCSGARFNTAPRHAEAPPPASREPQPAPAACERTAGEARAET
jgi:hypothetical protein